MTDRDLHTAFQHLKEDVMNNVQTEQRLDAIVGRRPRIRPGLVAFAGAAAVVLLVGAALLALRPTNPAETIPPATDPIPTPTTLVETTLPQTTSGPVETTTTVPAVSLPDLREGTVLVANPGSGVFAASFGDTVAVDGDAAVGDGTNGIVFETGETISWARPNLPIVELFNAVDFGGDRLRLEDVTLIDGEPNIIFIVAGGVEDASYEEVWRYRLVDGDRAMLYQTGAYEGGVMRASLQSDNLVITRHAEGFSWFEFFNANGEPIQVTNPKPDGASFPVFVDQAVLSPDATTLIYFESDTPAPPEDNNWRIDLVVFDLANGVEDRRMEIELGNWYIDRVDFDGSAVVIGRMRWDGESWGTGPALRVDSLDPDAGVVTEVETIGVPSLVK